MVINLGYIVIGLYHGDLKDGPLIKRSMIVTQYEGPFVVLWRALYREWFKAPFEKTYIALAMTWIFMSPISWLLFYYYYYYYIFMVRQDGGMHLPHTLSTLERYA